MPALSEYTNVYGSALAHLRDKGYQVWYVAKTRLFWAEKDGWDFASESPCGLLGLVAIFELRAPRNYSEYWWRASDEIDLRSLPSSPPHAYDSIVGTLRARRPDRS